MLTMKRHNFCLLAFINYPVVCYRNIYLLINLPALSCNLYPFDEQVNVVQSVTIWDFNEKTAAALSEIVRQVIGAADIFHRFQLCNLEEDRQSTRLTSSHLGRPYA